MGGIKSSRIARYAQRDRSLRKESANSPFSILNYCS